MGWTVIGLIIIDVAINVIFQYPDDPKFVTPSRLQNYFEYGRSSEGKLARMTRCDPSMTAPITLAGWYSPLQIGELTNGGAQSFVTFYGMSHTVRLAHAFDRIKDQYSTRVVGAPGATGNWSFGAFKRDRGGGKSRVVVLGLMSFNIAMIDSVSSMNWNIDATMPYTADKFEVKGGNLNAVSPPFESFADYCSAFSDPVKWKAAKQRMLETDLLYSEFIVDANLLDHSALFRLLRRAYGQRLVFRARQASMSRTAYVADSNQVQTARAIVREFAIEARKSGMIPIVFLVNNLGYADVLYQSLKTTLDEHSIPYLSTHTIANPSDPRNYLSDSHFTDEIDNRLALELEQLIHSLTEN